MPFPIPSFAQQCLDAAEGVWGASFEHPFVRALAAGTLDADRFRFYQMQDARYLEAFADAAALIGTRWPDPTDKLWFLDAARIPTTRSESARRWGERRVTTMAVPTVDRTAASRTLSSARTLRRRDHATSPRRGA